jgi:agmatinase
MAINNHGLRWDGITDAGIPTFMKAPWVEMGSPEITKEKIKELRNKGVKAAVLGIPFDGTTTSRVGSSLGPRAIRHASCYYDSYHHDHGVYIAEKLKLCDCGDSYIEVGNVNMNMLHGADLAGAILRAGAMPIIIGGEHSISLAGAKAIDQVLEGKYGLIHLDAHLDADPDIDRFYHGSQVAAISRLDSFPSENMVLIGMRGTLNAKHYWDFVESEGMTCFPMRKILDQGVDKVVDQALEVATKGTNGFYLSIDMDVLESAYVPGAEAFTPFGLTVRELWSMLPKLGSNEKLVGFDVVEVSPHYDHSELTAMTAAGIIVELLAARASGKTL